MNEAVSCPECGEENGDLWDHDWGNREELTTSCGSCGKDFLIFRHITVRYEARPLKCDTIDRRCSECQWVGLLDHHMTPSGRCPNTGKVARREDVSGQTT